MTEPKEDPTDVKVTTAFLEGLGPGIFAAPMGVLGSAHVLHQLGILEGAPFEFLSRLVFTIGGAVLVILTVLYMARGLAIKGGIKSDFCDPVKMSFGSGFAIAVTLASRGLAIHELPGAQGLLLVGASLSFLFGVIVVRQWLRTSIAVRDISPAWFIPVAGTLVAAKALGDGGFMTLGLLMSGLGFFGWLMVLPIILKRLVTEPELPGTLRPMLFILVAPPGLAASAALTLFPATVASPLALACLGLGLFFLAVLVTMATDFEKARFSLAWWAYTFPTAAMASAGLAIAARVDVAGLTLMAHGLAGLNIFLTLGVSGAALRSLASKPGQ